MGVQNSCHDLPHSTPLGNIGGGGQNFLCGGQFPGHEQKNLEEGTDGKEDDKVA